MAPPSRLPLAFALLSLVTFGEALPSLLVYSRTVGYRHDSIPTAIAAIQNMSSGLFSPTFSEDPSLFTPSQLAAFDVIAFLSNSNVVDASGAVTADVLDADGVEALREWLTGEGKGLVGLHAATACLFDDESFGVGMGSWFSYHPQIQNATFTKLVEHPTIDMLPDRYITYEEVYNFRTDPRDVNATVLLTVDATSYTDPEEGTTGYYQGSPHPIAWYRDTPVDLGNGTHNGTMPGRLWMTSLGHTNSTWESALHQAHVQAGLVWVMEGVVTSNSSTSTSTSSVTGTTSASPTAVATAKSMATAFMSHAPSPSMLWAVLIGGAGALVVFAMG